MSSVVGVDLGTTYSAVATVDTTGRPVIITNEGKNITPSCVMKENDQLVVGYIPEARYGNPGFQVGARFKRQMGGETTTRLGSTDFTPTDLSAAVLSEMKRVALAEIGNITEAVVTIPANFQQEARDATMLAAKKAGLPVKYIINEPTAAALYYAHINGANLNGNYAVYDLGGGTFDVSIIRAMGNDIEVIASEGVAKLGGDDFDKALRALVIEKANVQLSLNLDAENNNLPELALSEMAKRKITLSTRGSAKFLVEGEIVEVTRAEFEEAIRALVNQAELLCETVMDDAGIKPSDIQEVFLAGGSTRIPLVNESVKKVFCKEPTATADVDEVVALGAALYASLKSDPTSLSAAQAATISKMKVSEISTYYFGTISINYNKARQVDEKQNLVIISKGEKLPCSITKQFETIADGQTSIHCQVTKSGSPESDPRFVTVIWEGDLQLPPDRPRGQKIDITYEFDENGMMKCSFMDVASGEQTKVDLDSLGGEPASSAIDKFLVD